jgi:hypothetical protein
VIIWRQAAERNSRRATAASCSSVQTIRSQPRGTAPSRRLSTSRSVLVDAEEARRPLEADRLQVLD